MIQPGLSVANLIRLHRLQHGTTPRVSMRPPAKVIAQMRFHLAICFDQKAHAPFVAQQSGGDTKAIGTKIKKCIETTCRAA